MTDFDEDLLLHRALAGSANDDDWVVLDTIALRDPAVWERLARALRDDRELAAAIDAASSFVEDVELPRTATHLTSRARGAAGWLVAAAVALAAVFSHVSIPLQSVARDGALPVGAETVAELPKLYLESRRGPGGVEVLYVKRTVERAVVSEMLEFQNDDAGRTVAVPATIPSSHRPSTL